MSEPKTGPSVRYQKDPFGYIAIWQLVTFTHVLCPACYAKEVAHLGNRKQSGEAREKPEE